MPSGKRAKQQRREATATRTPPPVRSKGGPRGARQASPRALAIGGGIVAAVIVAVVLAVVLSGGKSTPQTSGYLKYGNHRSVVALPGATDVYNLFKGIPESGFLLGNPNAPATLTEFIDLQCPLCQKFETEQLPTIVRRYVRTGKLNIKLEPWSILSAPDSPRGQAATIAASLQNAGFQFAEMLYLNQGVENSGWLTTDMVGKAASSVDGLQPQLVLNGLNSSKVKSIVNTVDNTANALPPYQGQRGTPTLLLNHKGKPAHIVSVGVPQDPAAFLAKIDAAIAG